MERVWLTHLVMLEILRTVIRIRDLNMAMGSRAGLRFIGGGLAGELVNVHFDKRLPVCLASTRGWSMLPRGQGDGQALQDASCAFGLHSNLYPMALRDIQLG